MAANETHQVLPLLICLPPIFLSHILAWTIKKYSLASYYQQGVDWVFITTFLTRNYLSRVEITILFSVRPDIRPIGI